MSAGRGAGAAGRGAGAGAARRPAPERLTVALPKGRLQVQAGALLAHAVGLDPAPILARSRRLSFDADGPGLRFLSVRAADVAAYVEQGAADLGVVGLDVLREERRDLYEPLDLGIGTCRMVLAARPGFERVPGRPLRVATKYPRITADWLARVGSPGEIMTLHGAVELGPVLGVVDAIVDITETGRTIEENGLTVLEEVMAVSARLVVNRVSLKRAPERVRGLVSALARARTQVAMAE